MNNLFGGWRHMCALDSAGSPQLRGFKATEINDDDVLSLTSDNAAPSSSGLVSQQCTVMAASIKAQSDGQQSIRARQQH
ncbi:unnamed protein product [Dicrocoelium dendriticum]|nr:unnamed protein product [Dicrocoelium dendriticum]